MNGIDISRYQKGIDLSVVPTDFVIIKATQGTTIHDSNFDSAIEQCSHLGKLKGAYHYAEGTNPENEAEYFVSVVGVYIGSTTLFLDWEGQCNDLFNSGEDVDWCLRFLRKVKELTGVTAGIYMSKSTTTAHDWSAVANEGYPLWVAQYPNYDSTGYQENPWRNNNNFGAWNQPIIFQYASTGNLNGYNGNLDLDKCYISVEEWNNLAKGVYGGNLSPSSSSLDDVANAVLRGEYGNGDERRQRIESEGYNYDEVQARVNELVNNSTPTEPTKTAEDIANAVIRGEYGNGDERRQRIESEGYNYDEVQEIVNHLCGTSQPSSTYTPTIDDLAQAVLAGEYGNGDERRTNLENAGYNYDEVQARVNEILNPTPTLSLDDVANAVLRGEYGNGDERRQRIESEGYNYDEVQARVNELVNGNSRSIDDIANAVIRGEYGNGDERRQRIESEGYNYDEVQARVNELM